MAATLNELAKMLDKMGINYDKNDERIHFGSKDDDQVYLFVRLLEDGELLNITVQLDDPNGNFLQVPYDHKYIKEFMGYLLHQTYQYKIGFWSYDPTDGDVRFKITHSIESNDLTEDQFKRLIGVARNTADDGAVEIRQILATGKVSSQSSSSSSDLSPDLMAEFAEFLAMKAGKSSGTDGI